MKPQITIEKEQNRDYFTRKYEEAKRILYTEAKGNLEYVYSRLLEKGVSKPTSRKIIRKLNGSRLRRFIRLIKATHIGSIAVLVSAFLYGIIKAPWNLIFLVTGVAGAIFIIVKLIQLNNSKRNHRNTPEVFLQS